MVGSLFAVCARAASGHAIAPPRTAMNSLRLMLTSRLSSYPEPAAAGLISASQTKNDFPVLLRIDWAAVIKSGNPLDLGKLISLFQVDEMNAPIYGHGSL